MGALSSRASGARERAGASTHVRTERELPYRAELDGIRALAVLAVMVFHIFPRDGGYDYLGGFLGVDVFFVLSGYLITTLLVREHESRGTIRLGAFYMRRALRLVPALLLTLIFAGLVTA